MQLSEGGGGKFQECCQREEVFHDVFHIFAIVFPIVEQ